MAQLRPVNRRALRRYGEFWRALSLVGNALAAAETTAKKAADTPGAHWSAPTAEELQAAAKKAGDALHVMASAARRWEAELVSREWRR